MHRANFSPLVGEQIVPLTFILQTDVVTSVDSAADSVESLVVCDQWKSISDLFHWRFFDHRVSDRVVYVKLVCNFVLVFIDTACNADFVVGQLDTPRVIPDFEIRWYPLVLELVLHRVP